MAENDQTPEPTPVEKVDSTPKRGRVIVYQGGPSQSLNVLNQHAPASPIPATKDKADVNPAVADVHDAFINFQTVPGSRDQLLAPPFDFDIVADLVSKNSILPPLIDAMVVNIDGTGAEIIVNEKLVDEEKEVDEKTEKKEKSAVQEYFDEPFPGQSFLTQRRQMRYEQESIGNAYLSDSADVYMTTGATFNLNFSGDDAINGLFIDDIAQAGGTWGASGSSADNPVS